MLQGDIQMIKIAPTPDEAYEICKKYAPNCAIGQNGYWTSGIKTSHENVGGSTSFGSTSSSGSSSFGSSASFGTGSFNAFDTESSSAIRTGSSSEISSGSFGNENFGSFNEQRTPLSSVQTSGFGIRGDAYERGWYISNKY